MFMRADRHTNMTKPLSLSTILQTDLKMDATVWFGVWERVGWIDLAQDRKRSVMINFITLYCTIILERLRKTMLKPSKGGGCVTTGFEQNPSDSIDAAYNSFVSLFQVSGAICLTVAHS